MVKSESARLDSLDGIRALAIVGVFLLHVNRPWFPGGAYGVDVFFVLSAFLITRILLRERGRGGVRYGAFYLRRAFRLGPALVLWLVVVAAPTAVVAHEVSQIPISTLGSLFYFNDFLQAWTSDVADVYDQSWSLAIEEQFYFVWPLVLALTAGWLTPLGLRRAMVVFVAASVGIFLAFGNYFLPTGHIVAIALGCWAAYWSLESKETSRLTPILADSRVALLALAALGAGFVLPVTGSGGYAMACLIAVAATALTLHATLNSSSIVSKVLASPVPRWVGVRSYGIYLYGLTLLILIPMLVHLQLRVAVFVDVVVIGVVVGLSYRFVEDPIRKRGQDWLDRRGEIASSEAELGLNERSESGTGTA